MDSENDGSDEFSFLRGAGFTTGLMGEYLAIPGAMGPVTIDAAGSIPVVFTIRPLSRGALACTYSLYYYCWPLIILWQIGRPLVHPGTILRDFTFS